MLKTTPSGVGVSSVGMAEVKVASMVSPLAVAECRAAGIDRTVVFAPFLVISLVVSCPVLALNPVTPPNFQKGRKPPMSITAPAAMVMMSEVDSLLSGKSGLLRSARTRRRVTDGYWLRGGCWPPR